MSIALPDASRRARRRHGVLAASGVITALLTVGLVLSVPTERPSSTQLPESVRLTPAPGGVAAVSDRHGPTFTVDGRAAGFTHDELGAALAASNLGPRVSSAAGIPIYEATLATQSWGDPASTLARLRSELPVPDQGQAAETVAQSLHYRIIAGDPNGDYAVVSLLADTAQARRAGGLARVDVTLRWDAEDWRIRVPTPRPSVHPDTLGYTLLGRLP